MPIVPMTLPDAPPLPLPVMPDLDVVMDEDAKNSGPDYDPLTGISVTVDDEGGVTIDFGAKQKKSADSDDFGANLAEDMSPMDRAGLADQILQGINADIESRHQLDQTYERGIDLLGLILEQASSDATGEGTVSKIYNPLLLEAVVRYQSTAQAEMLPSAGPVKCVDYSKTEDPVRMKLAEDFEKDFNFYLTSVRKEYYPDTRKMLFAQGLCGNGFKKVYMCPIRRAPVSDFVSMTDMIISNDAVSIHNCGRITHRSMMRYSVLKRLQIAGKYLDIDLIPPNETTTSVEKKVRRVEGIGTSVRREDQRYTIYETYTEIDMEDYGMAEKGQPEGLPLPYRVTIDRDSREILEIRRNWKKGDEDYRALIRFVKFGFIPGLGFYDYGLIHLLGNTARALTAIDRQLIDAGQFANFPGMLRSDIGGRQETTQTRISPGGSQTIKTGGLPIQQVVMPLPYKEPSQVLAALSKSMADDGRRLGMTAEVNVGEGRADVPVGTTVALIEQATKVMAAIHKQNHSSQQEEFELLKELFAEDPQALWKFAKNPARKWEQSEEFADVDLVPASDPNVPSHIHRVMQATALSQLVNVFPNLDRQWALAIILTTLGYDPSKAITPPQPPAPPPPPPPKPIDPSKMADVQVKAQQEKREAATAVMETQARQSEQQAEDTQKQLDRESHERIEQIKLEEARIKSQEKPAGDDE